jgi:S1-C subfamily serine protease
MVIHFGNPGNRKTTEIDVGFIDALDYCIPKDVRAINYDEGENQGVQYLMSKGMIKPGFSGGPCVNMKGEVVGVMSKLFLQGQIANVDHACISVPSKVVKGVVQQMLASGNVQKPYVGLSFVQNNPGIAVVKVQKGSPAEKAGVCVGDVILTANGKSVDSYEDISGVIGFDLGTVLELKVNRNNTILDLKINT